MDALMLPLNWQRVKLGDIATFLKGKGLSKSQVSSNAKHECILYGELFTYYDRVITNIKNFTNIYNNPILSLSNDVLMPSSDVTPNGLATASCILKEGVILGGDILIIRPNSNLLSGRFLAYCIVCNKNQVLSKVVGSTVYHLYAKDLKDFEIPLPPLNEQIAIANILSDVDRYLCALRALILKKESVKKALSFELLSQRKRLRGFNQAWQRVRLGDICEIVKGQQINKISLNNTDKYPVINGGIDFLGYTNKFNVSKNTIAISEGGTCGYVRFMKSDFWSGGHNYSLQKISNKVNNLCLYHILKSYEKDIMKLGVGSGLKNIQLKALKDFEILLPPLNEQIAIANILSALDNEIISLKNKKRQFENIKKALNHDLMSAKIRVLKKINFITK
ncbi:restriction endonuclease subunit S [Helicobacter pylori]|uniref:restriction endonuclease subunit S n=1 Tax=Helicobacter pylori TaxID=210 RepID=UPI00165B1BFC|nr:restriction endonuclease subunit S [Helicobacter pylori]